jgi:hypothetical protein
MYIYIYIYIYIYVYIYIYIYILIGLYGGEGKYGLSFIGSTNIQNCNISSTCCDGYDGHNISSCTYVCLIPKNSHTVGTCVHNDYHYICLF